MTIQACDHPVDVGSVGVEHGLLDDGRDVAQQQEQHARQLIHVVALLTTRTPHQNNEDTSIILEYIQRSNFQKKISELD